MTPGEKWIKLLRAYGPVPDGDAQEAEHVDKLADRLGLTRLTFEHPAWPEIDACFPIDTGDFKSVVLTGTAGDGKTTLCYQLREKLTGTAASVDESSLGIEKFEVVTPNGIRRVTMIYDLTGWRERDDSGTLKPHCVAVLEEAAAHAHGTGGHAYVLAVNDGQLHETIRALPSDCSQALRDFGKDLISLHAAGKNEADSLPLLRLVNLSRIPSDVLFGLCLDNVLERSEWKCLTEEKQSALFDDNSPIPTNYALLKEPGIREKLLLIARIADATGHHLPLRSILIVITNALLGHPDAPDRLIRPGWANKNLSSAGRHKAALHLNIFGFNLSPMARERREIYRFLAMLHAGEETTNDLDEIIIFGPRTDDLKEVYDTLVANDPYKQRNPALDELILQYIRGDISEGQQSSRFLAELAHERRRVLVHASNDLVKEHKLWSTTVFHYAGDFIEYFLNPIREGRPLEKNRVRRLAAGLNRVWTGLLLDENAHEVFLASGLDLSTSPVSDLLLKEIVIADTPPGFEIIADGTFPNAVLRANHREFEFALSLPRFEFLMRVAAGAMPSSFSRESYEDFLSLKQCCLRDLCIRPNPEMLTRIDVTMNGQIHKEHIHLS